MSLNDILYLKEENFCANIITQFEVGKIYSVKSELNKIAKKHFISISEYKKLVRKELSLKNKIPLYISNQLLFFNIKINDTIYWINYFNILKICYQDNILVIFKTGDILELEINKKQIKKELNKVKEVLEYIASL